MGFSSCSELLLKIDRKKLSREKFFFSFTSSKPTVSSMRNTMSSAEFKPLSVKRTP